jgi:hypothetical protein
MLERVARWMADRTVVGQELFDEGWKKGYIDCTNDIDEAATAEEAAVPEIMTVEDILEETGVLDLSGTQVGLFPPEWYEQQLDQVWSD